MQTGPDILFARALARRASLRTDQTDCLRLADGPGDGLGDLFVDDYAGRWVVQTRQSAALPGWLARAGGAARSVYWKRLEQAQKQPPAHAFGEPVTEPFATREHGLRYEIDFAAGYSQGLFLDQRDNRRRVLERSKPGHEVLNLFSYTCGFSVCAAAAGAHAVSVDLANPALEWGRRNFRLNGIDPAGHEFIGGETGDWLKRFGKKGRRFDTIVLDPPTFSRDKKGKVFRVEKDFGRLAAAAAALLRPRGALLCTTNQRTLPKGAFAALIRSELPNPDAYTLTVAPMPPDFTGEPYLKTIWLTRK